MSQELRWKLRLRRDLQKLASEYRATKKEMIKALNSGIDFEGD